ncbi:hypothetical protein Tco_0706461 [Tanacetum coccineum]|uniref:Uncharacterized protein n=1 Tax=Tanacetum coccineum TaxID=301880 RepID=A0ABQ4Y7L8_9ASTR
MDSQSTQTIKLPILQPGEYDLWKMRMEQYLQCIDYTLWEIIENGNAPIVTKTVDGKETVIPPTSVEEKAQRRAELKARSTLLMAWKFLGRCFTGCHLHFPTCVNFLRWFDPPMCQLSIQIIPGLLTSRNELEEILAMVEEKRLKTQALRKFRQAARSTARLFQHEDADGGSASN